MDVSLYSSELDESIGKVGGSLPSCPQVAHSLGRETDTSIKHWYQRAKHQKSRLNQAEWQQERMF